VTQELVLTIVARDKPGVVQAVSEVIADHDGNWMDSSMIRLGGAFAGIVRVAVPAERIAAFEAALAGLTGQGLAVTSHDAGTPEPAGGAAAHLALSGVDHPGIVRDVSSALANSGVSIEELSTEQFPGSMTGESMFSATARIVIPPDADVDALRERLEMLAQDIMVEIDIRAGST